MGWLFNRPNRRNRHTCQPSTRRADLAFLPNDGGKGGGAKECPVIQDDQGFFDADWEYVKAGLAEGWLTDAYRHWWGIRNNEKVMIRVYYLSPPE